MDENISKEEALEKVHGKIKTILTPSGDTVMIREQNGHDDDIISNSKESQTGNSFNLFVKAIVVHSERFNGALTLENVLSLPLRDKYFILVSSRIFSLGSNLKFEWNWGTDEKKDMQGYEEELSEYIWDYNTPFPKEGEEGYFKERIAPYEASDNFIEFKVTSGKKLKMDYLNGNGEKYLLEASKKEEISINEGLRARNLRVHDGNEYLEISNFGVLTAKDMMEIRSVVDQHDKEVNLLTKLTHPGTKEEQQVPIIGVTDFFFPLSI